jgi:hypothetical protein
VLHPLGQLNRAALASIVQIRSRQICRPLGHLSAVQNLLAERSPN